MSGRGRGRGGGRGATTRSTDKHKPAQRGTRNTDTKSPIRGSSALGRGSVRTPRSSSSSRGSPSVPSPHRGKPKPLNKGNVSPVRPDHKLIPTVKRTSSEPAPRATTKRNASPTPAEIKVESASKLGPRRAVNLLEKKLEEKRPQSAPPDEKQSRKKPLPRITDVQDPPEIVDGENMKNNIVGKETLTANGVSVNDNDTKPVKAVKVAKKGTEKKNEEEGAASDSEISFKFGSPVKGEKPVIDEISCHNEIGQNVVSQTITGIVKSIDTTEKEENGENERGRDPQKAEAHSAPHSPLKPLPLSPLRSAPQTSLKGKMSLENSPHRETDKLSAFERDENVTSGNDFAAKMTKNLFSKICQDTGTKGETIVAEENASTAKEFRGEVLAKMLRENFAKAVHKGEEVANVTSDADMKTSLFTIIKNAMTMSKVRTEAAGYVLEEDTQSNISSNPDGSSDQSELSSDVENIIRKIINEEHKNGAKENGGSEDLKENEEKSNLPKSKNDTNSVNSDPESVIDGDTGPVDTSKKGKISENLIQDLVVILNKKRIREQGKKGKKVKNKARSDNEMLLDVLMAQEDKKGGSPHPQTIQRSECVTQEEMAHIESQVNKGPVAIELGIDDVTFEMEGAGDPGPIIPQSIEGFNTSAVTLDQLEKGMIPVDSIRIEQIEADGTTTKINSQINHMDLDDVPVEFEGVKVVMDSAEVSPIKASAQLSPIKPKSIIDKTKLFSQMNDIFAKDTHNALKDKPVYQKRSKPTDNNLKLKRSVSPKGSVKNKEKTNSSKSSSPLKGEWKVGNSTSKTESSKLNSSLCKETSNNLSKSQNSTKEETPKIVNSLNEEDSKADNVSNEERSILASSLKEEAINSTCTLMEDDQNNTKHLKLKNSSDVINRNPVKPMVGTIITIDNEKDKDKGLSIEKVVENEHTVGEIQSNLAQVELEETALTVAELPTNKIKEMLPSEENATHCINEPIVNQLLMLPRDETVVSETDETDQSSKEFKSTVIDKEPISRTEEKKIINEDEEENEDEVNELIEQTRKIMEGEDDRTGEPDTITMYATNSCTNKQSQNTAQTIGVPIQVPDIASEDATKEPPSIPKLTPNKNSELTKSLRKVRLNKKSPVKTPIKEKWEQKVSISPSKSLLIRSQHTPNLSMDLTPGSSSISMTISPSPQDQETCSRQVPITPSRAGTEVFDFTDDEDIPLTHLDLEVIDASKKSPLAIVIPDQHLDVPVDKKCGLLGSSPGKMTIKKIDVSPTVLSKLDAMAAVAAVHTVLISPSHGETQQLNGHVTSEEAQNAHGASLVKQATIASKGKRRKRKLHESDGGDTEDDLDHQNKEVKPKRNKNISGTSLNNADNNVSQTSPGWQPATTSRPSSAQENNKTHRPQSPPNTERSERPLSVERGERSEGPVVAVGGRKLEILPSLEREKRSERPPSAEEGRGSERSTFMEGGKQTEILISTEVSGRLEGPSSAESEWKCGRSPSAEGGRRTERPPSVASVEGGRRMDRPSSAASITSLASNNGKKEADVDKGDDMDGKFSPDSQKSTEDKPSVKAICTVVPEKASSFAIHPLRTCADCCFYCQLKFGMLDTPLHVAQLKTMDKQSFAMEFTGFDRDACLCDRCFRFLDRKAQHKDYSDGKGAVKPTENPKEEKVKRCVVRTCNKGVMGLVSRKWLIRLKKKLIKKVSLDWDKVSKASVKASFPVCDKHNLLVEFYSNCGLCKRKLTVGGICTLGMTKQEVEDMNLLLREDHIPADLKENNYVCKLCKTFCGIKQKSLQPDYLKNHKTHKAFYKDYRRRLYIYLELEEEDASSTNKSEKPPKKMFKVSQSDDTSCKITIRAHTPDLGPNEKRTTKHKDKDFASPSAESRMHVDIGETNIDLSDDLDNVPCQVKIQFDLNTKKLWQDLHYPYGNYTSFFRHLILLEKYWRSGDLTLSNTASIKGSVYLKSVQNRIKAYEGKQKGTAVSDADLSANTRPDLDIPSAPTMIHIPGEPVLANLNTDSPSPKPTSPLKSPSHSNKSSESSTILRIPNFPAPRSPSLLSPRSDTGDRQASSPLPPKIRVRQDLMATLGLVANDSANIVQQNRILPSERISQDRNASPARVNSVDRPLQSSNRPPASVNLPSQASSTPNLAKLLNESSVSPSNIMEITPKEVSTLIAPQKKSSNSQLFKNTESSGAIPLTFNNSIAEVLAAASKAKSQHTREPSPKPEVTITPKSSVKQFPNSPNLPQMLDITSIPSSKWGKLDMSQKMTTVNSSFNSPSPSGGGLSILRRTPSTGSNANPLTNMSKLLQIQSPGLPPHIIAQQALPARSTPKVMSRPPGPVTSNLRPVQISSGKPSGIQTVNKKSLTTVLDRLSGLGTTPVIPSSSSSLVQQLQAPPMSSRPPVVQKPGPKSIKEAAIRAQFQGNMATQSPPKSRTPDVQPKKGPMTGRSSLPGNVFVPSSQSHSGMPIGQPMVQFPSQQMDLNALLGTQSGANSLLSQSLTFGPPNPQAAQAALLMAGMSGLSQSQAQAAMQELLKSTQFQQTMSTQFQQNHNRIRAPPPLKNMTGRSSNVPTKHE